MNGRNVVAGRHLCGCHPSARTRTSDGRQGPIMSVNGGNTNHNLFTLNGSVFTHFNQTTGFNPPPPDAIQEVRIQTHNFTAEYGHTAGSQVSIVSKAGSNTFRGTAWEFHRNSELNARSFFQTRKPEQEQNQAGARRRRHHPQQAVLVRLAPAFVDRGEAGSSQTVVPTPAAREFHRPQHGAVNPVNPITNAPFTDSTGAPCIGETPSGRAASVPSPRACFKPTCRCRRPGPWSRCPPRRAITPVHGSRRLPHLDGIS